MKPSDRTSTTKQVDEAWENIKTEMSPKGAPTDDTGNIKDPPGAGELKAAAYGITASPQNKGLPPHDAVKTAMDIAAPNPADPFKPGFTTTKAPGGVIVKRTNGVSAFVPQEQFERLAQIRAEKLKTLTKPAPVAAPEKPGMLSQMGTAVGNAGANYVARMKQLRDQAAQNGR